MSFEQLKNEIARLNSEEQAKLISFTLQLRHERDDAYRNEVTNRLNDGNKSHWLTPDEFERRLGNG